MADPTEPDSPDGDDPAVRSEIAFVGRPQSRKQVSALALRVGGATLEEITRVVGFASEEEAAKAIDKALSEELKHDPRNRDRMRDIANRRLERLLRAVWPKAIDPKNGEQLAAVGKAKEIIDRHIKLYGLDAPQQIHVSTPEAAELEAWVMRVAGENAPDLEEFDILEGEVISIHDETEQAG